MGFAGNFAPPWKRAPLTLVNHGPQRHTSSAMTPDEMQAVLQSNNIGFSARDMPHGRQFRFEDGAIANVYHSGKVNWQGKKTLTVDRVASLCGQAVAEPSAPVVLVPSSETVSASHNKVFIVY